MTNPACIIDDCFQGEVHVLPRDRALKAQMAEEAVAFRRADKPHYDDLATLIAAAGPSDDF